MTKQNDNFPPQATRWEAWRLTEGDAERVSLGTFDGRDDATRAAAWDFARRNRSREKLTGLVTDFSGCGTVGDMLRLFYDMPPLQSLLEHCSSRQDADGIRLSFALPTGGDISPSTTYLINTCDGD